VIARNSLNRSCQRLSVNTRQFDISPMLTDPDLVPFSPPERPVRGLSGLRTFLRNYIETFPRSTYELGTTRVTTRLSDVLYVCDPELIQDLLVARADLFGRDAMTRRTLAPMIGETSIFLAEGTEWRWQRRSVAPTFQYDMLLSYVPIFTEMAARQITRWRYGEDGPVDVAAAMTRTTFEVTAETMVGPSAGFDIQRYGDAISQAFGVTSWLFLFAMLSLPKWLPFPGRRRAINARDYIHGEMIRIVAARRANPTSGTDLLDRLLAARSAGRGRSLTDAELVTNLLTFINAGHDTTAAALTWTLWLISRDGILQEQLFEEIRRVAREDPIEPAHIEGLEFCRQVVQEAMRLYPPAPTLLRQAKTTTLLGGHQINPKTQIVIPIFALHRHTKLWMNPNTFDPSRFARDQVKARSRYIYLPFGAGPRTCIGASFAMIETVAILAMLVRTFRFRPLMNYKPRPIARMSLRPLGGLPLMISTR
jgi:cytochrome P450